MKADREVRDRRKVVRKAIGDYLESQTRWGKFMARPSQVRAAAKQIEIASRRKRESQSKTEAAA